MLPTRVVTALTYHTNYILGRQLSEMEVKLTRQGRKIQTELTQEMRKRLGTYHEEGFTLEDIKHVEKLLNIQIKVVCSENFNSVIYSGKEKDTIIYLYKKGNHFDVINSMKAFLGSVNYCDKCDSTYQNKDKHKCKKTPNVCNLCKKPAHSEDEKNKIYCEVCNRYCYNQDCLDHHESACKEIYKCRGCNMILSRSKEHKCGYSFCFNCMEPCKTNEHQCYIQNKQQNGGRCDSLCVCNTEDKNAFLRAFLEENREELFKVPKIKSLHKRFMTGEITKECYTVLFNYILSGIITRKNGCRYTEKYIWVGYEAEQDAGVHVANLIVAHYIDGTKVTFKTNEEFCKWLISKDHKGCTAMAHNAKGYDSQFILKYCIENTLKPYTIYNGTKLMMLEVNGLIKIIDSHNFVASPLSDFPKTFGLKELKKGYFPHFFNTRDNQNYVGPIPDKKYYGEATKKAKGRKEFLEWYNESVKEDYVFDFQKEFMEYCNSDVDILCRGCLEHRKQFLEIANIDLFQYITIASVCMGIYRSKYLQENTMTVIKSDKKDMFSEASIAWFSTFQGVQHALNGGEVMTCGAKVDGFNKETNTVYQYHGCFWHGCLDCYHEDTINNINHETMGDLREKTRRRSKQIKDAGYNLIEMWGISGLKAKIIKRFRINVPKS